MRPPARYPTTVRNVTELRLTGTAAGVVWLEQQEAEDLTPHVEGGRIELTLLACQSTFWGTRFRELSLAVRMEDDSYFMVAACNSVRFFAWVERRLFHTPYRHGDVQVDETRFHAADEQGVFARAARGAEHAGVPGDDGWEGAIFLPRGRVFFAKLSGPSMVYPYDAAADTFQVASRAPFALLEHFRPETWQVRTGAVHSRSKSRRRP